MEDRRFDRLTRTLSGLNTRRGTLAALLGGLALPLVSAPLTGARTRRGQAVHAEKRRKKTCQSGLLTCKIKVGKKKKTFCVDAQSDPNNCGGCGLTCAAGQTCRGGACTCNGAPCSGCCDGNTCQGGTIDQQCGTNGAACQVCTGGRSCQNGVCTCPAGQTFCGGACVDTRTDAANCGSCGNTCTLPRTCGGGNPGTPGVCGCTKTTCAAQERNCGTIPDGCDGDLDCGMCDGGASEKETCGGGGVPNVCGCVPQGSVTTHRDFCCTSSCCRDELPEGQCRCAGGCG